MTNSGEGLDGRADGMVDASASGSGNAGGNASASGSGNAGPSGRAGPGRDARPRAWLHALADAIRRRWWLVPATLVAALLIAMLYLRQAQYLYAAELRVNAAPGSSGSRPASPLGGLAALAGLGGTSEQVSPFRFYLDAVYSSEVAARLARNDRLMHRLFVAEWNPQARRWRESPSLLGGLREGLIAALGLPEFGWQPPDATRLQAYIAASVGVRQSVKTPLAVIGYSHPDPVFAVEFLQLLHETVDRYLREQQARRTRGNIDYLSGKLATATLAEQRQALVAALAEQERQAMLVNAGPSYAADAFDVATASPEPVRPRPVALLAGSAVAGLVLGLVLAALAGGAAQRRTRAAAADA
jgi:ElaB/YqjD/DUF883 family membrane-anchored ribosome-binding protein